MSSYLTVVYGARRFKVPVTPSTLLGQVRDEVCAGVGVASADYGLARQGRPLDLTVPLRFANLVNNAQVDLVRSAAAAPDAPVRVKVRVPGGKDFVGTLAGRARVADVAAAAGRPGAPLVLGGGPVVADAASELRSLGGASGGLLFTVQPTGSSQPRAGASAPPATRAARSAGASSPAAAGTAPGVVAGAASGAPGAGAARDAVVVAKPPPRAVDADDPPEMGVSQFRSYHSHLKAQAEPAMVSRETRERMKTERRNQIEASTIRVKLPDNSFLEGKFQRGEHGEQVYAFVRSHLRRRSQPFVLKSMNPVLTLAPEHHLLNDCDFGSRALLVLEWTGAPPPAAEPVLNDEAMARVKPVGSKGKDGPVKSQVKQSETKPQPEDAGGDDKKKESFKKKVVPKWMRLHKS